MQDVGYGVLQLLSTQAGGGPITGTHLSLSQAHTQITRGQALQAMSLIRRSRLEQLRSHLRTADRRWPDSPCVDHEPKVKRRMVEDLLYIWIFK
jgi:hypothetical protein